MQENQDTKPETSRADEGLLDLSAEFIHELDGGAFGLEINKAIRTAVADIENRPCSIKGKTQKRSVLIQVDLESEVAEDARANEKGTGRWILVSIGVVPHVSVKIPKVKGGRTAVKIKRGKPVFNSEFPESFNDRSLYRE